MSVDATTCGAPGGAHRNADARRTVFIEDMSLGFSRSRRKIVTIDDIAAFAEISGDRNPIHLDQEYAASTRFGGVVAHGILGAGLISAVIGEELPGHGAIYLSQTLSFRAPVRPGDLVEATCTVAAVDLDRRRVTLTCTASVGEVVVLDGEAVVLAPSKSRRRKAA